MEENGMQGGSQTGSERYAEWESEPPGSVLWDYLSVLLRRIWIIVPIVVIVTTVGVVRAFRVPRTYHAAAKLLVERQGPRLMQFESGLQDAYGWDPNYYSTQTQLARSRAVMELALENPSLQGMFRISEAPEPEPPRGSWLQELRRTLLAVLGGEPAPPPEPWERLAGHIRAVHMRDTQFIQIQGVSGNRYRAATVANAVAKAYQEYHRRRKVETLGEAFESLQRERVKEERALLQAEEALQRFREQAEGIGAGSTEEKPPAITRLERLNAELTKVQLNRISLDAQIAVMRDVLTIDEKLSDSVEERLFAMPVVQTDSTLMEARRALSRAEKEADLLADTYGAAHPTLLASRTNVVLLRRQFQQGLRESIQAQENRLRMLVREETELQEKYEEQQKTALELARETFELTRLENEVERHRRLHDALVDRMREVDVSSGLARTNVQIVEQASPPASPVPVNRRRRILLSLMFGLFLGGGLAFVLENLDDTIKTPEDLRERINVPFLGFVPMIEDERRKTGAHPAPGPSSGPPPRNHGIRTSLRARMARLVPGLSPWDLQEDTSSDSERAFRGRIVQLESVSSVAEAYRSIRANLFYATPADEIKMLAVTSCRPKEGKTTTTTNLALSVAQTGRRVLLIDADLHRPTVHRTLSMRGERGLTNVLVGQAHWKDEIQHTVCNGETVQSLDVLCAGPSSPNPTELLGSNRMRDLLLEVREAYDWVLIDTPPVLFVSDASVLSIRCDGVLLVVKSGISTRTLLNRTREQLERVHARMVGCILNHVTVSRVGRHYSSYYSYGYSRYTRDYERSYYADEPESIDRGAIERAEVRGALHEDSRPAAGADAPRAGVAAERRRRERGSPAPVPETEQPPPAEADAASMRRRQYQAELKRAGLHVSAGNPRDAQAVLERLVAARPDLDAGWETLTLALYAARDEEGLQTLLGRLDAMEAQGGHVYPLALGRLAMLRANTASATAYLQQALERGGRNAAVLEAVVDLDLAGADIEALRVHIKKLAAADARNPVGLRAQASLAVLHGDLDHAERLLRSSLELRQSPDTLTDLAWVLHEKGSLSEVEKLVRTGLRLNERIPKLWHTLGKVLAETRRIDEARRAFEHGLKLDPGDVNSLLDLAGLEIENGNRRRGAELLDLADRNPARLSAADESRIVELRRRV